MVNSIQFFMLLGDVREVLMELARKSVRARLFVQKSGFA